MRGIPRPKNKNKNKKNKKKEEAPAAANLLKPDDKKEKTLNKEKISKNQNKE